MTWSTSVILTAAMVLAADHPRPPDEAAGLAQELVKISKERLRASEDYAELASLRAVLRHLDVAPETLEELAEPGELIESSEGDGRLQVVIAPAFAAELRHSLVAEREVDRVKLVVRWSAWDGKPRAVELTLDPAARRAKFAGGGGWEFEGEDFRIVLLTRPQLVVRWGNDGACHLQVLNGHARYQVTFRPRPKAPGRASRHSHAWAAGQRTLSPDPCGTDLGDLKTVVPLTDGDLLLVKPGEDPLQLGTFGEDDTFLLSLFREWGGRATSTRSAWQHDLLEAVARLDELDQAAREPSGPPRLADRQRLVEKRKGLMLQIRAGVDQMRLMTCETCETIVRLRLAELRARFRLLCLRQDDELAQAGAYREFLDDLRQLNP